MIKCLNCGKNYPDWQNQCPYCGATALAGTKKGLIPVIAGIGIVLIIAIIMALMWLFPSAPPIPGINTSNPPNVTISLPPPCSLMITAVKQPGDNLMVTNGGGQCPAKTLHVKVNNIEIGQLGTTYGASQTYPVGPGTNTVVVVGDFNNNTSVVVYGPKTL